jgi:purine nucleoside phosphorylase
MLSQLATSRPVGPEQGHHHFIPVPTAEERTAPCDALSLEANSLIGATSAGIFREHTEPNSMCISILESRGEQQPRHHALPARPRH